MGLLNWMQAILKTLLTKLSPTLKTLAENKSESIRVQSQQPTEKPSNSFLFKATVKNKEAVGILFFGDKSWPAISGRWGNGYLPEGLYEAYGFWDESGDAYSYKDEHGRKIGFYIRLEPKFKTDRTQLLIHFDGNVEGTLGCIGIKPTGYLNALDTCSDLKRIMQVGKLPLEVKYS